ncbi:hypothetical protein ACPYO6_02360 [Georgenia sp. Z1344]
MTDHDTPQGRRTGDRPPSRWRFVATLVLAAIAVAVVVWLVDLAFDS